MVLLWTEMLDGQTDWHLSGFSQLMQQHWGLTFYLVISERMNVKSCERKPEAGLCCQDDDALLKHHKKGVTVAAAAATSAFRTALVQPHSPACDRDSTQTHSASLPLSPSSTSLCCFICFHLLSLSPCYHLRLFFLKPFFTFCLLSPSFFVAVLIETGTFGQTEAGHFYFLARKSSYSYYKCVRLFMWCCSSLPWIFLGFFTFDLLHLFPDPGLCVVLYFM